MADLAGARLGRLVRLHRTLEDFEPWDLLPRLPEHSWAAAWWDPIEDRSFVALGLLADAELTGPHRFASAGEFLARLQPIERGEPVAASPCAVAGFAFRAGGHRSAEWREWGDGHLWVPRLLVHRTGRHCRAVAAAWADDPRAEAALRDAFGDLEHWSGRRTAATHGGKATPVADEAQRASWNDDVARARAAFAGRDLEKVVLARRAEFGSPTPFDPANTASRLREQQPGCTTFLVRQAGGSAWVGATPEELARVEGRALATVALAGTRRRAGNEGAERADLLGSEKDRREHRFVVEAILQSLGGVTESIHAPAEPTVARFAQVQHLRTPIHAQLRAGVGAVEVAARLHPTPAVGGVPRDPALQWLAEHERSDRGWYAGPIGWLSADGDGTFVVAIRSALLNGRTAAAWVGCGLVDGSDADDEWRETEVKLGAMAGALAATP